MKIPSPIRGYIGAILKTAPVFTWGYVNAEKVLYCVNGSDLSFRWSLEGKKVRPFCVIQLDELRKFTIANSLVFYFFSSSTFIWTVCHSQELFSLMNNLSLLLQTVSFSIFFSLSTSIWTVCHSQELFSLMNYLSLLLQTVSFSIFFRRRHLFELSATRKSVMSQPHSQDAPSTHAKK